MYTGLPDEVDVPLNGKFTMTKQNKEEDYLDAVPILNENLRFGEEYDIETRNIMKSKKQSKIVKKTVLILF